MPAPSLGRRDLLRAAALAGAGAGSGAAQPTAPANTPPPLRPGQLFADPDLSFSSQISLGLSYYGGGNPGKIFAIAAQIKDGDFASAFEAFHGAGVEARGWADDASKKGRRVSAREASLWATNYFHTALRFLDGAQRPDRLLPVWQEAHAAWTEATALFRPTVDPVQIPYENTTLSGWFLRAGEPRSRRPLVILNNGADGSELGMYVLGAAGGMARGYNCLIFNGPGQNDSLWLKNLYFRHDWEKVITPVVDFALAHPEVDAKRIALLGVSQGGYWVPRALAFEHRIAAGVADPGVSNVSDTWFSHLPKPLLDMFEAGKKEQFDSVADLGVRMNPRSAAALKFRMRPYGITSYYDVFRAVRQYDLKDVAAEIRCPMLITNPESEQFFIGQSQRLYEMLRCPKTLIDFTRAQGADLHCEVNAPGYRDFCIYNWLDETLA